VLKKIVKKIDQNTGRVKLRESDEAIMYAGVDTNDYRFSDGGGDTQN
jgi:hypothetical protein